MANGRCTATARGSAVQTSGTIGMSLAISPRHTRRDEASRVMHLGRRWMFLAAAPVIAIAIPGSMRLFQSDSTKTPAVASNVRLVADLSSRRLRIYQDDTLVVQYPI